MATKSTSPRSGAVSRKPQARPPVLRFRMRITHQDHIAIGPGKVDLLEALERTGSITAAAKSLDMSYRRAWLLFDEMNQAMREPLVASAKGGASGGGSTLTAAGRQVIALYRRIEQEAATACQKDIKALIGLLAR